MWLRKFVQNVLFMCMCVRVYNSWSDTYTQKENSGTVNERAFSFVFKVLFIVRKSKLLSSVFFCCCILLWLQYRHARGKKSETNIDNSNSVFYWQRNNWIIEKWQIVFLLSFFFWYDKICQSIGRKNQIKFWKRKEARQRRQQQTESVHTQSGSNHLISSNNNININYNTHKK